MTCNAGEMLTSYCGKRLRRQDLSQHDTPAQERHTITHMHNNDWQTTASHYFA